jgi:hypothetical protein
VNWHRIKLAVAALAPALLYACWKGSHYLFERFNCLGSLKDAQPCERFGLDVTSILSAFAWWGMLLWLPALAVAILVFSKELWLRFRMRKQ